MITRIHVQNFKAFENLAVDRMPKFMCLIGVNGSGKTSFLQLLTFIRTLVLGEVDKWTVGGKPCETKTLSFAGASRRNFELTVDFSIGNTNQCYTWNLTYNLYDGQLVREEIKCSDTNKTILSFSQGELRALCYDAPFRVSPRGSSLSIPIDDEILVAIKQELSGFAGVGVLDPVAIADAARVQRGVCEIDENGSGLPAFVSQLSPEQRTEYTRLITRFYSDFDEVAIKGGKFGWKRIVFTELKRSLDALHMSYGTLRYMVMAAFKYTSARLVYFDEVDNGINQEYLGKVVDLLKSFQDKQVVVATHNVQFLNNLDDETLRNGVYFFYKGRGHQTHVKRFFDIPGMSDALEFDSGGSIVSSTDLVKLGERLFNEGGK